MCAFTMARLPDGYSICVVRFKRQESYPILRTSHLQGAAVAPCGVFDAEDLVAQISLAGAAAF